MISPRLKRKARKELKKGDGDLSWRLVTVTDPGSDASEAYRTVRTNLFYAVVDAPLRVVALTSAGPAEGKSTTCANLGVVLAQADKNTLIIDCDFRNPVVHKIFGLRNIWGTVNVLAGEDSPQDVWQEVLTPKLKVLPVGPIPPNPAEILSSERFANFVAQVRHRFDYVLLDVPHIELFSDAAAVAAQADGTLLVLDAQSTRRGDLRRAMRSLETVRSNILGLVMNNAEVSKGSYYSAYTYA